MIPLVSPTFLSSPGSQSYSILSPNGIRFQSSGMESTPHAEDTDSKKVFVEFEQYIDDSRPRNQLVITVQDSFDCQFQDPPKIKKNKVPLFQTINNQNSSETLIQKQKEHFQKHRELQCLVKNLQCQNLKLREENNDLKEQKQDYVIKHQHFKQIIRKKDQVVSNQKQCIQSLQHKVDGFQKEAVYNLKQFQDKNREKDIKLRDVYRKMQKLLQMNKGLQIDLKQSNEKILALEREIQMNAYNQILQNRVRIKESVFTINKQNTMDQNNRKSFQNPQRKGRLSNISGLEKKTKSISNTGRIKH